MHHEQNVGRRGLRVYYDVRVEIVVLDFDCLKTNGIRARNSFPLYYVNMYNVYIILYMNEKIKL